MRSCIVHTLVSLTLAAILLQGVISCAKVSTVEEETEVCPVQLSFSLSPLQATKSNLAALPEIAADPGFTGMTDIVMVPFATDQHITGTDKSRFYAVSLPSLTQIAGGTNAHLYPSSEVTIPTKTASVLLYGRAPYSGTDIASKQLYGSLIPTGFKEMNNNHPASELGFEPERMLPDGTPAAASAIASTLNQIVLGNPYRVTALYDGNKTMEVTVNWNAEVGDQNLRASFLQFTNEGHLMPGSGQMVEDLITTLYRMLKGYQSYNSGQCETVRNGIVFPLSHADGTGTPLCYNELYEGLRDVLLERIVDCSALEVNPTDLSVTFADENLSNYPTSLGLPSGAAVIRWTPTGFVVPMEEGVEGIAPMSRFCYPPALYYYVNTTIKTSAEDNVNTAYDGGYTQWGQILQHYNFGTSVSRSTRSVALVNPIQFAVGMLVATVEASSARLQDNDGNLASTVDVSGEQFPVTGIIVGGQYAQRFNFTPVSSEDDQQYYLYDNRVEGVYLKAKKSDEKLAEIRSLSLPTPPGKDVYFSLELENNSGKTFYGADGRVLPGNKFYLVGKLVMPQEPALPSVFVQDHYTTVNCKIVSLEGAYHAVPDLGSPQLVMGIQAQVNWILSTPGTLLLD